MTFKTYIKALWLLLAVGVFSACSDNDMATKNEDKKPAKVFSLLSKVLRQVPRLAM